jgi:prepilin-type processing-associated H-X9-DG protein
MTERTALFLAGLSHKWSPLVLLQLVVFGVTMYGAGVLRARTRASADALIRRTGMVIRMVSRVLFAASLAIFGIAFVHLGCAALVAHSVQCMSNMKQLALGTLMYSEDFDERLPVAAQWSEKIAPYLKKAAQSETNHSGDPFLCPAAESPASYGMNAALSGVSMSDMEVAQVNVLLFEADAPNRSFAGGVQDVARERHDGAPNFAFADGHAKSANAFVREELLNWTLKDTRKQHRTAP